MRVLIILQAYCKLDIDQRSKWYSESMYRISNSQVVIFYKYMSCIGHINVIILVCHRDLNDVFYYKYMN